MLETQTKELARLPTRKERKQVPGPKTAAKANSAERCVRLSVRICWMCRWRAWKQYWSRSGGTQKQKMRAKGSQWSGCGGKSWNCRWLSLAHSQPTSSANKSMTLPRSLCSALSTRSHEVERIIWNLTATDAVRRL